jgi:myo-inositol-1(or 4)-monophosphatase
MPNRVVDPLASELLRLAVEVAAAGADLARRIRDTAITQVETKSTDTDVVTEADHAVERLIVERLRRARPDDAILSEESGALAATTPDTGRVRWILDPIDGTVNYLYGIPHYGVSLAVELDGTTVAGVVHNAATDVSWTAQSGHGAFRQGRRLTCSPVTDLGQALVTTGFGYDPARRTHQARVLHGLAAHIRDIRRFGAAALDLCLTAEGATDAFYEMGLNLWDQAAGALIATESGLTVTALHDDTPSSTFVLAAPPAIHAELRAILIDLDADNGP